MAWGVVIAAGGHEATEFATAVGTSRKALMPLGGRPSLHHVLDAVRESGIGPCVTVSGMDVAPFVTHGAFVAEGESAIDNVLLGAEHLGVDAILALPADMPAVTPTALRRFVAQVNEARRQSRWFAAGLCPSPQFRQRYPYFPMRSLRLREGHFQSGGFYAGDREGLQSARELLQAMRRNRKNPLAMLLKVGLGTVIRYAVGRLSLADAVRRAEHILQGQAILVTDAPPESILDFDTLEEYHLLQRHERWS